MSFVSGRAAAVLAAALLLLSCGGGGDGDGSGDPDPEPVPTLQISSSAISVTATPGELGPEEAIVLTISNLPASGLFLQYDHTTNGLETVEFELDGQARGELLLSFKAPGMLVNDTYADTIEVHVCPDEDCSSEITGSPRTVSIAYEVTGDGVATAEIDSSDISVMADKRSYDMPQGLAQITLSQAPPSGVVVVATENSPTILGTLSIGNDTLRSLYINFLEPNNLALGEYEGNVTVRLCYHASCVREVTGSPFSISTTYTVSLGVEEGMPSLTALRREQLDHNVIDAEYSAAMNAIVMVGDAPANAIYVYDMDTGTETEQPLDKAPTAVSVSPNGLTAAVGHDALISLVDLPSVGSPGAPAPITANVSAYVIDILLDDAGRAFAVSYLNTAEMHSVDVAQNTDQLSTAYVDRIRLKPDGQSVYGVATFPQVRQVDKFDVSTGAANFLYTWRYDDGEHTSCLNLWFDEDGDRIFTGCGESFSASADPAQDMLYMGTLELNPGQPQSMIRAMSHSNALGEIALIDWNQCNPNPMSHPCFTRLTYYDDVFLNAMVRYGIGPITLGNTQYAYAGRFVFHDAGTGHKYLIGELEEPPSEDQKSWLTVVE